MSLPGPALELVRLSTAIAESLEARDLDEAERLTEARARVLATAAPVPGGPGHPVSPALAGACAAVREADRRSGAALRAAIADVHRELGGLATGAAAMRAYDTARSCAPGFVDRRD